jgi:hypothetical protein
VTASLKDKGARPKCLDLADNLASRTFARPHCLDTGLWKRRKRFWVSRRRTLPWDYFPLVRHPAGTKNYQGRFLSSAGSCCSNMVDSVAGAGDPSAYANASG